MKKIIWGKNYTALCKEAPAWKELLKEENEQETIEVCEEENQNGEWVLAVKKEQETGEKKKYYLSGRYAPEKMAEWKTEHVKKAGFGSVLLILGCGDGRMFQYLQKKIEKDTMIIVYEPSMRIFRTMLKHVDLTEILKENKIGFYVEGANEMDLEKVLTYAVTIDTLTKIQVIIQGNYPVLFPEETGKTIDLLKKRVEEVQVNWNTQVAFTNESGVNYISNFSYMYDHYTINSFLRKLPEDVPVIVVAAGPSLDKNIKELKAAVGHACIIACDTALKPLLKHGIRPDFFVVVDPRKPIELFEEPEIASIPMITGLNIPVAVMKMHTGVKILYCDTRVMEDLMKYVLQQWKEEKEMYAVPTGGSVANNAFSIGRMFGAKTIILMGQDLALSGEKEHAEGTFQKDRTFSEEKLEQFPKVEGMDGSMIPTLTNLKGYLEWFEKQIQIYSELQVIDATEGGALIHGSKIVTLRESIQTYCTGEFDAEKWIEQQEKHFSEMEKKKALEYFHSLPKRLKQVREKAKRGILEYKHMETLADKPTRSRMQFQKHYKRVKRINRFMEDDPIAELVMESLKDIEYTLRSNIYHVKQDEWDDIKESAQIGKRYLQDLVGAIDDLQPLFEELAKFTGK